MLLSDAAASVPHLCKSGYRDQTALSRIAGPGKRCIYEGKKRPTVLVSVEWMNRTPLETIRKDHKIFLLIPNNTNLSDD